jgi:hypothetical protein
MKMNLPFIREEVTPSEAEARIAAINEPYKMEILQSIRARDPEAAITIYHIGEKEHPAHWWGGGARWGKGGRKREGHEAVAREEKGGAWGEGRALHASPMGAAGCRSRDCGTLTPLADSLPPGVSPIVHQLWRFVSLCPMLCVLAGGTCVPAPMLRAQAASTQLPLTWRQWQAPTGGATRRTPCCRCGERGKGGGQQWHLPVG